MTAARRRLRRYVSKEYRKAQVAAVPFVPVLITSLADGRISSGEWVAMIATFLLPAGVALADNGKAGE